MIKTDGLSYRQLQKAISQNRLPYLRRLQQNRSHRLHPFYSGMPSTTPAVQAELFYGVETSIPAMEFIDREQQERYVLLFPAAAEAMAQKLQREGTPLLAGGTSYSNIYTGGADEARYCIQTMRLRSLPHLVSSVKMVFHFLVRPDKFLRVLGYGCLEVLIGLYDFIRGALEGKNIFKEMKFIPTRVVVCILLREMIRVRVKMDLRKGVPIVHASFLGYDEQSHRRGPDSVFAHWTLKGIDAVIEDLHRAAQNSVRRRYRIIVYSDHGQEGVTPYREENHRTVEAAVQQTAGAFEAGQGDGRGKKNAKRSASRHSRHLSRQSETQNGKTATRKFAGKKIQVTSFGPLGHIYLPQPMADASKATLAEALVKQANIPLVCYLKGDTPVAVNRKGTFALAENGRQLLGEDHPYPARTAADLARTCRHPNAGDLVISGWDPDGRPITFAVENGAHGGPGKEETSGFVFLPGAIAARRSGKQLPARRHESTPTHNVSPSFRQDPRFGIGRRAPQRLHLAEGRHLQHPQLHQYGPENGYGKYRQGHRTDGRRYCRPAGSRCPQT